MTRVFVSIPIKGKAGLDMIRRDLSTYPNVKMSPPGQLHITLSFIGEIPDSKIPQVTSIVKNAVSGVISSPITLKGVGFFPNVKRPNVVWTGLSTEIPLERIALDIAKGLENAGIPHDDKPFKPHITLGRVRGPADFTDLLTKYRNKEFLSFTPESANVMKSELSAAGAKHSVLFSCPFEINSERLSNNL